MAKKIPKVWKWVIGAIILFLISFQVTIQFFVGPMIEKAIVQSVQNATGNLYQVDSIDVDLEYLDRIFVVNDLRLSYDSLVFAQRQDSGLARPTLFELSVPKLEIEILDVAEAYKNKNYFLKSVSIHQPTLNLIDYSTLADNRRKPPRVDQLYSLISNWAKGLYIEEVNILNGKFQLNDPDKNDPNAFKAKDISISIKNFRLDSTTVPELDRPFYADEISASVNVADYSYVFPDSSYTLKAGKLGISTLTGNIFAENFEIRPKSLVFPDKDKSSNDLQRSQFNVLIPRLQIEETGFHQAYFNRELNLGSIRILEPQITQLGKVIRDSIEVDSINPADIYDRIAPFFNKIIVSRLSVENGSFQKVSSWGDSDGSILLDGIGLKLNRLRFDSAMLKPDERLFFSDELELSLRAFNIGLSKGNYRLKGNYAFLSSIAEKLSARNLEFAPVKEKYQSAFRSGGDLINFQIPNLKLDGLDLSQTWYDRILDVNEFTIHEPKIELINLPKVERETVDSLAQVNLYSLVSDFLNSFTIRSFRINNGAFNFNSSVQKNENEFLASDINVNIKNFKLAPDAQERNDNPFYADDIAIKGNIADYSFILPDSSYTVQARSIGISTADSAIFADSIFINPIISRGQGPPDENQNKAEIVLPKIYLSGLDISQIWFNKFLDIDSLDISKPYVRLNSQILRPNKVEFKSLKEIDLYPYISPRLNALKIETVHVDSAEFFRKRIQGDSISTLHLPTVSVDVFNFYLDSATQIGPDNLLYSDNININIGQVSQLLKDSSHTFRIDGLNLSTKEGEITISNIEMTPVDSIISKKGIKNQFTFQVPSVNIKGVNSFELYEDKSLDVSKVQINFPKVSLTNYPHLEREDIDSIARSDLYLLISDQLNTLKVRSLVVLGGTFNLNEDNSLSENNFTAEDIMVLITNFELDSAARAKTNNPFYADDIDVSININDYSFMLPDSTYSIKVGNIGVSTADSSILAESVQITPQIGNQKIDSANQIFDLYLPAVRFQGLNTNDVYFERLVNLERIDLERPQIKMFSRKKDKEPDSLRIYKVLSQQMDALTVNTINIKDGVFEQVLPDGEKGNPIFLPRFSLEMSQFELDSIGLITDGRFLYSNEINLKIKDYSIPLKDSIYTLSSQEITFSTLDSRIIFDSLMLKSNYKISEFAKRKGYAIDHIDVVTHQVNGENVDLFALADRQAIDILKLNIELKLKNR